jgi:hypothetical protein
MSDEERVRHAMDLGTNFTRVTLVVLLGLVVSWFNDLRPRQTEIRAALVSKTASQDTAELVRVNTRIKRLNDDLDKLATEKGTKAAEFREKKRVELEELAKTARRMRADQRPARLSFDQARAVTKSATFRFFGVELGVSGIWSYVCWLSLFVAALANLAVGRLHVLKLASGANASESRPLPAWCAIGSPLFRAVVNSGVPADTLSWVLVAMTILTLAIAVLVVRASFAVHYLFEDRFVLLGTLFAIVAILATLATWLYPAGVSRSHPVRHRRLALAGILGVVLIPMVTREQAVTSARASYFSPRRIRKKSNSLYEPGFYQDTATSQIFHVEESGRNRHLSTCLSRLQRLSSTLDCSQAILLHASAVVPWCRTFAKQNLRDSPELVVTTIAEILDRMPLGKEVGRQHHSMNLIDLFASVAQPESQDKWRFLPSLEPSKDKPADRSDARLGQAEAIAQSRDVRMLRLDDRRNPRHLYITERRFDHLLDRLEAENDRRKNGQTIIEMMRNSGSSNSLPKTSFAGRLREFVSERDEKWRDTKWLAKWELRRKRILAYGGHGRRG